jgi:hypothetical protein
MRYIQTLVIVAMMLLVSCSSYKTTLSQSADLSKYQYASVIKDDPHSPADMVDVEIGIYDALDKSRLQLVGEQAINELSPDQKQELLMARYSSMVTEKGAIVSINLPRGIMPVRVFKRIGYADRFKGCYQTNYQADSRDIPEEISCDTGGVNCFLRSQHMTAMRQRR